MAYMSQENKATKTPRIKALCKGFGIKATVAVRHHSTLVINIAAGPIDFIGNYNAVTAHVRMRQPPHMQTLISGSMDVNPYHYQEQFDGEALGFLSELFAICDEGNWDKSDLQTDYFNVGWYVDVNVGHWNKPYVYTGVQS
jgi:hypothetical protein